jgi:transcriptional regulator with XRE-family HTH domain
MMSSSHPNAAGQILRRLRQQRGLTLTEVAASVGISVPVLSRKERGEQAIERKDIRAIIEQFRLSPWEAYELWTGAGFVPEPVELPIQPASLRTFANTFLLKIPFPAYIITPLGYLLAWNQEFETLWTPSQRAIKPLHLLDIILSTQVSTRMASAWERYVRQALHMLYQWSLRRGREPRFDWLLKTLSERYGAAFDKPWQKMQSSASLRARVASYREMLVPQQTSAGTITYIALRGVSHVPQEYELIVLVPFGAESHERYQQVRETMPPSRLYMHVSESLSGGNSAPDDPPGPAQKNTPADT